MIDSHVQLWYFTLIGRGKGEKPNVRKVDELLSFVSIVAYSARLRGPLAGFSFINCHPLLSKLACTAYLHDVT